ncbi:HAMP domain-containing sensor histidine kinase [Faecalicatena contorta]|uniref:histidine kinase n=1 Tax=Faecalicatena contorta TaxID=39482 RepID=A0A315ZZH8_9FIRM|nr:HAMP domain-containing sensor histidine kinase [Faecalicatena contorta]PWJ51061.1 signal transduction histidine kinase [Faecalicatena contorta]SUQ13629.1 Signal transduction histidine kinase [Faecalicatena contorta]
MKPRRWMIGITAFLLVYFCLIIGYLRGQETPVLDIAQMNAAAKEAEKSIQEKTEIQTGEKIAAEIGRAIDFKIVLLDDPEYEKIIYEGLANRATILDLKDGDAMIGKIVFPLETEAEEALKDHLFWMIVILFAGLLLFIWGLGAVVYVRFVRPFLKLKGFASHVAAGNLDFPLPIHKRNYFGAFTESFDLMREELKQARQGEYEANRSKKEMVAGLSHDIKTPVSTIKAHCELITLKSSEEDTIQKTKIINEKADMIDHLISDMFHATLEDLTVLKINCREEMSTILDDMLGQMNHLKRIHKVNPIPECLIFCDALRLSQVIDNIIHNSYKYTKSHIEVSSGIEQGYLRMTLRDFGEGVEDSEVPMLCQKFYRGKNSSGTSGSGLGLYLARQFMEGMKGSIDIYCDKGFVVTLYLRIAGSQFNAGG